MRFRSTSLTDLLVLGVCGMVAASLLALQVQDRRSTARRSQCSDNLRKLGLAFHNYHSAYKIIPPGSGGTSFGSESEPLRGNANRLSVFVALTPFYEEQRIWESVSNPLAQAGKTFPPMGPVPWYPSEQYAPWGMRSKTLACPTDPDVAKFPRASSYVINYGDGVVSVGAPIDFELAPYVIDRASTRGAFIRQHPLRFRDFLDGLANTLLLSESKIAGAKLAKGVPGLALDPSQCIVAAAKPGQTFWPDGRDACWADGSLRSVGFQTILPPNSPSATSDVGELEGVISASSHHADGVHVLFCDGMVKFARNSIDAGKSNLASVATPTKGQAYAPPGSESPYGLWGAIGTRASAETVNHDHDSLSEPPIEWSEEEEQQLQTIPVEDWTKIDGTTIRGRLVEVVNQSRAIIVTESRDTQSIDLSDLQSEDAYRAVKRHLTKEMEASQEILAALETSLDMLEEKEFERFVDTMFKADDESDMRRNLLGELVANRGNIIQQFDEVIQALRDGNAQIQWRDGGNAVEIQAARGRLLLIHENERWLLTK